MFLAGMQFPGAGSHETPTELGLAPLEAMTATVFAANTFCSIVLLMLPVIVVLLGEHVGHLAHGLAP
jgi:hypothetical protein